MEFIKYYIKIPFVLNEDFIMKILVFVCIVLLIWLYGIYVSLIQKRNKVGEAFSSIDVQLKKRYDLIPNILTIAQKFMEHERGLIEDVTKLRTEVLSLSNNFESVNKKIELDNLIKDKMKQLLVSVENYPQLKSDQTMVTAMQTYNEVEEHIAAARRFYNSAANELKNAVEIFPSSLIAAIFNVKAVDFFTATESERKPINAQDYLK